MIKLTPQQCFEEACVVYNQAKTIISDLSEYARQKNSKFSTEIAIRQFDMILQSILLCIAVSDDKFVSVERMFIEHITDYGNVLNRVNREMKAKNPEWKEIRFIDIESLDGEYKKKFALVCAATVEALADEFSRFFAPIDAVQERDYLDELQTCIFKLCIYLAAVDEGGIDETGEPTEEHLIGIKIYEQLFKSNWKKYLGEIW